MGDVDILASLGKEKKFSISFFWWSCIEEGISSIPMAHFDYAILPHQSTKLIS